MSYYKYYAGITSQVGFCSTPLRLDSYSRCQFNCAYCFAGTRQGYGRGGKLRVSNPNSLRHRLLRVRQGKISSALDEFISNRVPFQLGGMSDPFSKIEENRNVTLEFLKILNEFNYPVIISTKSDLIASKKYLGLLAESNIYVRFSTTVVGEKLRRTIDRGCPGMSKILDAASTLSKLGIPVCFRFQPIIPGQEIHGFDLISQADSVGVKHISAEYLKVPIDADRNFSANLKFLFNGEPIAGYKKLGAILRGHEYILPLHKRKDYLIAFAKKARTKKITFGFADNDLLLHSDGRSCCSASNLYLKNANFFNSNIVSLAKDKPHGEKIKFEEYLTTWIPKKSISTYLNSKTRIKNHTNNRPDWLVYLKGMWKGEQGLYSPDFFDGIERISEKDTNGLPVYKRIKSEFELEYETCSSYPR